jgi:long-chain acyl-CoA synthetase
MIFSNLEEFSNSIAFTTSEEDISYSEFLIDINKICIKINTRNVAFVICENKVESVVGYAAFLKKGVVPLLISKSIDWELLLGLIDEYKPNYIWANKEIVEKLNWQIVDHNRSFALALNLEQISHQLHPELALLLMTSGSTGSPTLVKLTMNNLKSNANSICNSLRIDNTDKPITTLPMNYSYGLSIINSHLLQGATVILTDSSIISPDFWQLCNSKNATSFGGVPYTYQMLRRIGFDKMELNSLNKLTQAGGKLDKSTSLYFAEICNKKIIKFFTMYGQTEATARMSCLDPEFSILKSGSIGRAISGGEFFIIDEKSNVITESETIGELVYKGSNVSMGYSRSLNDLAKDDENCGILYTGDLAKFDCDGFYYLVGRKKRFLKIFGNRIS